MNKPEIKKLKESIPSNGVKIIELYNKIDNQLLNTQPNYQRKLVWKKQHKYAFIDTILMNFPFPEIYIASSDIDVDNMIATEVVVDGQQRLTTIVDYIKGAGDFMLQKKMVSFANLSSDEKKDFLNYKVSVKDLKDIGEDLIKEIFQRINSTEYSLNVVEKNNAIFGDGEIAIFCKQLIDPDFIPTEDETDIIVNVVERKLISDFFNHNEIFTQNDRKRMYDFQYVMLLTSTILEGNYFTRSTKVDEYLEEYNGQFSNYPKVLQLLSSSLAFLSKLKFSKKSYWFNKANLFTLIIELSKFSLDKINLVQLELQLLELENKMDLFFSNDSESDLQDISEDEKKYFQNARHGSHEKDAREHRGKIINELLQKSLHLESSLAGSFEEKNLEFLNSKSISFATITPTKTGLNKNIMDAIAGVRDFLSSVEIHNYENQQFGPDHKVTLNVNFHNSDNSQTPSHMSLYRSNGRGDYRIWFSDLKSFANANEKLVLTLLNGTINVLNISKIDYSNILAFEVE